MAQHVFIFHNTDPVSVEFADPPNGAIKKMITIESHIFLLTTSNCVYHGEVEIGENDNYSVIMRKIDVSGVDISTDLKCLFVVYVNGHVGKINPSNLEIVETIFMRDEVKFCSHG